MSQPRYAFEDFRPGEVVEYGGLVVDRDQMVEFAQEYDPQPMHVSEKAAHGSMLGELIGSGWYTTALLMRMNCEGFLLEATSMGAPGIDSVEWRAPVRAGDTLRVRREVLSARRSMTRSDVGIVKFAFDVMNQHDAVVMRQVGSIMFGRRREAA